MDEMWTAYDNTASIFNPTVWNLVEHAVKLCYLVYEHWPETHEFITRTIELWNRWIRLSFYNNIVQTTCTLYTHVSPILQCIGPCNLFVSVWSMFVNNRRSFNDWAYIRMYQLQYDEAGWIKSVTVNHKIYFGFNLM